MATAEQIDYPAPLPEDPADALLTEMLVPAPYEVPEKKAKKKSTGTRKGLRRKVISDSSSENTEVHSSHENEEEEEESSPPPPAGGIRKGRPKGPRREGPSSRLLHDGRFNRRGVVTQGQAPGEVVSIWIP